MADDFLSCCGCEESGLPVQKLPEWRWNEVTEDEEEEVSLSLARSASSKRVESWSSLGRLGPKDLDFSELTREATGLRRAVRSFQKL